MNYGLETCDTTALHSVFDSHPDIEKVILYGSRAKGCHKPFSDVDITLVGDISRNTLLQVMTEIDDLLLPYKFDICLFNNLTDKAFIDHIRRVGVDLYVR